jgi:hypothetical protein
MREFKLNSRYFWREFALFNLVFGLIIFLLSITRYKDASPLLSAVVLLVVNVCNAIHYLIWPPLKEIAIEPAAQELTYKLLWRQPVKVKLGQLIIDTRPWATRGGAKTGLSFYVDFKLLFRAAKGPWKADDLAQIYRLTTSARQI